MEKKLYDVSEDRCHVCNCKFDGHPCECERLAGETEEEEDGEEP